VKRKRFSVEQIVAVLKQAEVGVLVAELIPAKSWGLHQARVTCGDLLWGGLRAFQNSHSLKPLNL